MAKKQHFALGGTTTAKPGYSEKSQRVNEQAAMESGLPKRFGAYAASEMASRERHKRKKD